VKRLSLRQSLALWTLVPMVAFSLIVLALSSAWAWREVLDVASNHNADLARVAVRSLGSGRNPRILTRSVRNSATWHR
jgi:hypothetical protein